MVSHPSSLVQDNADLSLYENLKNPKWQPRHGAPKWQTGLRKESTPKVFDSITPSMRKVDHRETEEKRLSFKVATNVIASRAPERQLTAMSHVRANLVTSQS